MGKGNCWAGAVALWLTAAASWACYEPGGGPVEKGTTSFQILSVTASGLTEDSQGIPPRFIAGDRAEPIPYVVDAQTLPAGITVTQATNAVAQALQAWANVTSLRFQFDGLQNFGQPATNYSLGDNRLHIQLHNLYNVITNGAILGLAGPSWSSLSGLFPSGGLGGRVISREFNRTTSGFVILSHTNVAMQTLSTFTEVLCHEIGHALGMAHSSENPREPNTTLKEAMMYYRAHADGRGATLGAYDPPVIQQAYPTNNTPPYGYDRVIYCVTAFSPLTAHPEVRQVQLTGYDLQNSSLSVTLTNATAGNGTFSLATATLTYTPNGAIGDSGLIDPATSSFYDRVYVRYDDGTNASPYVLIRVVQFLFDSQPNGAPDSIPDSWRMQYFGSSTPVAGVSGADDDPDGDGLTNIQEFQAGTNPLQSDSGFRITALTSTNITWSGRPYELYEIQAGTTVGSYSRIGNPVVPTSGVIQTALPATTNAASFYRVRKVP